MRNVRLFSLWAGCLVTCLNAPLGVLQGAPATFTIDPAQSQITISGTALGNELLEQGPGSLTARFGGTFEADVTDSTIQFTGGSAIDAEPSGEWEPLPDGSFGKAPADYGAKATVLGSDTKASLRNTLLDATSGVLALASGTFDSAGIVFGFPTESTASLDYRVSGFLGTSGSKRLEGLSTNQVTTGGTLLTSGGTQTLTIPVDAKFSFTLLLSDDIKFTLTGQLVATRTLGPDLVFDSRSVTVGGDTVTLHWEAPPGQKFRVESSSDLKTWRERATGITSATTAYIWSAPTEGPIELFRLVK
ncbi:MAG: hypothetical protein HYY24_18695 [Verrucomicrobia bacterium]|nr:hypothetical protein [Verrucomicrobiota bacterium]